LAASQQRLFGTNGVRFVPGVSHDLDFAINLGEAVGTYFGSGEILVGMDGRLSSPALANATVAGLLSSGRDVAEGGLVPTPALQYGIKALGFRGRNFVTLSWKFSLPLSTSFATESAVKDFVIDPTP
jgi:phosphomannomutase/phosphoglucomutase